MTSWQCRPLIAADRDLLWELLYIALWDPPAGPRRPRSVRENPRIRKDVEGWGREDDVGLACHAKGSTETAGAGDYPQMKIDFRISS